jgi:mannose-1-phosphate guanylyltransferase / mannose-6-phosphate isomerase
MIKATPVIICGGSGTRLWPLSRTGFPKQYLCLTGNESLFQQAAKRLSHLGSADIEIAPLLIVTGEDHRFLASEQLRESGIKLGCALLELAGKNTAPAPTLAALAATQNGSDPVLVVTPADQTITSAMAFTNAMQLAIQEAANASIVILGITPNKPETGYGYIQLDSASASKDAISTVRRFVEKPYAATAQSYLNEGSYFWNAGMFVVKASAWLSALGQFRPDILQSTQSAWAKLTEDAQFSRLSKSEFQAIPSESEDCAVMENCPGSALPIKMIALNVGWSDLGAWGAVWQVLPKDDHGNAKFGGVITTDSRDTLTHSISHSVALVGVENVNMVETPAAVLVTNRAQSQSIKHIVASLKQQNREECKLHRKVRRSRGWYHTIDEGSRFEVKPKASLSLQKHHHRAEHWVVVTGTDENNKSDKVLTLTEKQSAYIPLREVLQLSNPGSIPLEIIEVESGSFLGEDHFARGSF